MVDLLGLLIKCYNKKMIFRHCGHICLTIADTLRNGYLMKWSAAIQSVIILSPSQNAYRKQAVSSSQREYLF